MIGAAPDKWRGTIAAIERERAKLLELQTENDRLAARADFKVTALHRVGLGPLALGDLLQQAVGSVHLHGPAGGREMVSASC